MPLQHTKPPLNELYKTPLTPVYMYTLRSFAFLRLSLLAVQALVVPGLEGFGYVPKSLYSVNSLQLAFSWRVETYKMVGWSSGSWLVGVIFAADGSIRLAIVGRGGSMFQCFVCKSAISFKK